MRVTKIVPIALCLALIALFTVSCDKEEPIKSTQATPLFNVQDEIPGLVEDVQSVKVAGFELIVGKGYPIDDLPDRVIERMQLNERSSKRSSAMRLFTITEYDHTGTPTPTLGQELKGLKGSTWPQVDNVSQSEPIESNMLYSYSDPKNLTNVSIGGHSYHRFQHWSWNNTGKVYGLSVGWDTGTSVIWVIDTDSHIVGEWCDLNGFRTWNETEASGVSLYDTDEDAVQWEYYYPEVCDE